jgi:CDGSH-type Zn-finger protein
MAEVSIRLRENGPLVVEGAFQLVDHQGNVFSAVSEKPAVALCRCGHSKNKPFCDGTHRTCGFVAGETAPTE